MNRKRGLAILVCLAVLFCVFALSLSGQLHVAPPALAFTALLVLAVSLFTDKESEATPQPIALLRLSATRAPPRR